MRICWRSGVLALLAGCGGAPVSPAPPPPLPPEHHEPPPAADFPPSGPADGSYTFRRVYPGATGGFRQTFELSITHTTASLRVVTADDDRARTNADVDRATFTGPQKTVEDQGTATTDAGTGELVLDMTTTHWRCQRMVVQVAAAGAHFTRVATESTCLEDSPFEPPTTTAVHVLSCRADDYPDGPPPLRGDASPQRRRDSHRWTFTPAPGIELLGDACSSRTGILRRAAG